MNNTTPAGTAPCSKEVTTNRVDAFTNFINEWINTNVKVFSRKENGNDSEVL